MARHTTFLASVAVSVLLATAAHAGSATYNSSGPSTAELEQRIDALETELQQTELNQSKSSSAMDAAISKMSGWWDNTSVSGRMYFDTSWIRNEVDGTKSGTNNGVGFDMKRFYIGIDHKFNDLYSADVTTDVTYDSMGSSATQLFIKKAYLQAAYSKAFTVRLGATDLPWIPFVEDVYGYRFVENTLIDRVKQGTSSDWGIHAAGKLLDGGMLNYAVAVVNGAGYKKPGTLAVGHFKSVDVEGRVNLNLSDFIFAVGGYYGKLGADQEGASDHHTASRLDALAAYKTKQVRLGFEYFSTHNMNGSDITSTGPGTRAQGYGGFASYQFNPQWGVFGRYDYVEPNNVPATQVKDNYFNVGIDYTPTKIVDFALVYKRDKADHGTISTQNGTIGGLSNGTYDEVGIFSQFRW